MIQERELEHNTDLMRSFAPGETDFAEYPRPYQPDRFAQPHEHQSSTVASSCSGSLLRTAEVVISLISLVALSPLMTVIALVIRLGDGGPVFHVGRRLGRNGRQFGCIKFRTMCLDAEMSLAHLLVERGDLAEEYCTYHKIRCDPRVTRAGRFLRLTSLDELPQLLNVLVGDMALVGPRPYLLDEYNKVVPNYADILSVKPGLTGYWQVKARNTASFSRRLRMERFYAARRNALWDIGLLLATPAAVVRRKGAS